MNELYSLAVEPWLPVATRDGKRIFIPIRDIARPDVLRIDTGRPDCDIAVTEFLIGLVAVGMGPSGAGEWKRCYETPPSPGEIDAAIAPFAHALVLNGDGPRFFQDLDPLENGAEEPVAALFMDAPAGHFVKEGTVTALSRRAAAIALVTLQTCAPTGGRGHFTSLRGGGAASTLIIPRTGDETPTLWQVLWANVPDGYKIEAEDADKVFPWLSGTRSADRVGGTTPVDVHQAQAFFGMPRRIRLNFTEGNDERCALFGETDRIAVKSYLTRPNGAKYPTETWRHPLSPYYQVKDKTSEAWLPLHFKAAAIDYRQWVGLTLKTKTGEVSLPADIVSLFLHKRAKEIGLKSSTRHRAGLLAAGYAMDNMKPLDFTEAMLPLISTGDPERDYDLAGCATAMIAGAELAASLLLLALKVALWSEKKAGQPDNSKAPLASARARFWADTENAFYDTLRDLAAKADDLGGRIYKEAKEAWLNTIRDAALAIFDDLAPIDSPESPDIRNIVNARKSLFFGLGGPAMFKALCLEAPEREKKDRKNGKANGKGRKAA